MSEKRSFNKFLLLWTGELANNCLDYLMRTNIPDEAQGRAWGMIGFLSQLGYVVAYALSGAAADTLGSISGRAGPREHSRTGKTSPLNHHLHPPTRSR